MREISDIFGEELKLINVGTSTFKDDLEFQGKDVIQVDWKPPAGGNKELINALDKIELSEEAINIANEKVVAIIKEANPFLIDIGTAKDVIPGMDENTILHAGPPIKWDNMCGPAKGAIIGALIYEGKAKDENEAKELAASGKIKFSPAHEHDSVGPMAGIISASMPVHVIYNKVHDNYAYCTVNEGLGKVLRYGAYNEEVIDRLKWIEEEFAPALKKALALVDGGINLKTIISQAVQMGDEGHNRNNAATSLFFREISSYLLETDLDKEVIGRVMQFMKDNNHYFLNLSMPACKVSLDAANNIENSTIVTVMARNGVEFGIKVSGLGPDKWFNAPANMVKGLLFPGYTEDDAALDIGDSTITETAGLGGFAMAGALPIVQFVGGTVNDAINYSESMYTITQSENPNYSIPTLDFRGSALGIDIRKVIEKVTLPIINTGIAHKTAGVGQIGAGIVNPSMECFEKAILEFVKENNKSEEIR